MIVSEARISANRLNALKSTGPRTAEGKQRSRANALKHGLCSSEVVPEDVKLVQVRSLDWFDALKPQNEFQCWLVSQVSILSLRIDRSERIERRVRDKISLRAELTWDSQRRVDAEFLGSGLTARPGEVVELLQQTPHGCEWLLTRWAMLAYSANIQEGVWTPDQTKLAFDLLATPSTFRDKRKPGTSLDFDGEVDDPFDDPASVARRQIAALKAQRAIVADLDESERALTEADLTNEGDPELRRLRRYEGGLHRRLRWCLTEFRKDIPFHRSPDHLRPNWDPKDEPALPPVPKTAEEIAAENHPVGSFQPPFDLTPEECSTDLTKPADIPAILSVRREKRLIKAQARRDAQRRKVEKLRKA